MISAEKKSSIYCPLKGRYHHKAAACRQCRYSKKCRPYQLWLQPELPLKFPASEILTLTFDQYSDGRVEHLLQLLNLTERRALTTLFLKTIRPAKDLYRKYRKNGLKDKSVIISFYQFIETRFFEDGSDSPAEMS